MSRLVGNRVLPLALLFALVIAIAIACPASTRASGGLERDYRVTRWTSENGLPQNTARRLYRTSDGYLWIGTLYGLARFDGLRFKVFGQMNTPAMTSDAINILVENKADGSLWIGTGEGLLRYSAQRQFARFLPDKDAAIGRMWASTQGGVWLQQRDNELTHWQPESSVTWRFPRTDALQQASYVEEEPGGTLLVVAGSGLCRVTPKTAQLERLGPPDSTLIGHFSSVRDSSGRIWICSLNGVWLWDRHQWNRPYITAPDGHWPRQILPTRNGAVWLVLDGLGLHQLRKDGSVLPFPGLTAPDGQIPMDMLEDPEGNLWVGTSAGLFRLQPHRIHAYTSEDGLPGDNILTATASPDGTVWLAGGRWIASIRDGVCTPLPTLNPDLGTLGPGMLVTDEGHLLTSAANDTVATLHNGAWSVAPPLTKGIAIGRPQTFLQDRHKRLWLGGRNGAAMIDGQTRIFYTVHEGLSTNDVRVLHEDRRDDIWFGTYGGGLNRMHNGRIDSFITGNGPYNNRAWWIHEDADGIFWVATQNGLNRFVPPGVPDPAKARTNTTSAAGPTEARTFTFLTSHGLMENVVNSVQEDAFGQLWLSGLRGIYRIPRKQLNEVASGTRSEVQCVAFGEADGMPTSECNGGEDQPAGCRDSLGRIWFPTGRGAIVVDPAGVELNERPPDVVIEQVLADDRVIHGDDLPPRDVATAAAPAPAVGSPMPPAFLPAGHGKVIEIHYTANSFVDPARVRFRFRLEGYEDAWRLDNQNRRTAFYTNLRPGEYRFIVRACNNHGVWNETGASFAFSVAPYFYQTWYFYLVCGLAAIGLAAAVQATRLRWQRRLLEIDAQRALANERTRIARDLHDDLGTALTGLALELDVIRSEEPQTKPSERLAASSRRTRDLAERMREVVWAINPRCDTVPSLAGFIEQHACQLLRLAGIETKLDFPEEIPPLPMDAEARHQLSLGVREAINNVVRHANATEVRLSLKVEGTIVAVEVRDNGRGFNPEQFAKTGHGLENLRHRLAQIGGTIHIDTHPGQGTTVTFRLPTGATALIREIRPHTLTRT